MILCDASFLIGAINTDDQDHDRCVKMFEVIRTQLVTTWPCLTEAMHIIGVQVGKQGQETLRGYLECGMLTIVPSVHDDIVRVCVLMRKYDDAPMDFADASLVAAAESLNITQILTLDSHFYAYRINDKTPFEVMP